MIVAVIVDATIIMKVVDAIAAMMMTATAKIKLI